MTRLLLVFGLAMCLACSEDGPARSSEGALPPEPFPSGSPDPVVTVRQDAGALALLDRADAVLYSPLLAGLHDVTYRFKTTRRPKVAVEVRWVEPDHVRSELALDADAGAATQNWTRVGGPKHLRDATSLVDLVVGTPNRAQYKGDEIILQSAGHVKIVARSERSLSRSLVEAVITFGDDGLPTCMETQTVNSKIILVPTYRRGPGGRWLVDKVDTRIEGGGKTRSTVMSFEYQRIGPYTMPHRVTLHGLDEEVVQEYLDIHVDQGLSKEQIR